MPNEGLIVPTHPKRITDLTGCRRSSLDTTVKPVSHNNHLVVPLMSSTNTHDPLHHHHHGASSGGGSYNGVNQGLNRIDPVAISLAAKAKRQQQQQQQQVQQQQQQRQTTVGSPSPKEQPPLSQININRRGSLDANVEYAVAMVNIVNPIYDMDDRDMCPFGTRRDSVCGNTNNNTNTNGINKKKNDSPKRPRRRILKKASTEEQNNQINILNDGNNNIVTCHHNTMDGISAITAVATIPPTHRPMTKIATISQTDDYNLVRKHSNFNNNNNNNNNRPLTLSERIHFH